MEFVYELAGDEFVAVVLESGIRWVYEINFTSEGFTDLFATVLCFNIVRLVTFYIRNRDIFVRTHTTFYTSLHEDIWKFTYLD